MHSRYRIRKRVDRWWLEGRHGGNWELLRVFTSHRAACACYDAGARKRGR